MAEKAGYRELSIIVDLINMGTTVDGEMAVGDKVIYIQQTKGLTHIEAKYVYTSTGHRKSCCYSHKTDVIIG